MRQTAHMYSDLFYSFTIGSVGAILFLLVDTRWWSGRSLQGSRTEPSIDNPLGLGIPD
jgi:hypothetical protein